MNLEDKINEDLPIYSGFDVFQREHLLQHLIDHYRISPFLMPVLSVVITIGLRCGSQLLTSSWHSSFER
jgi:hypothetical protein